MKKMILAFCVLTMLMSGCSENKKYERDTSPGTLQQATLEEVYEKFANEEDFGLLISFSYCSHCLDLKAILEPYLNDHHVIVYELVMDKLAPTRAEYYKASAELNKYLEDYSGTPSFYYIEKGKKKEEIIGFGEDSTIDMYDDIITKYRLDAKK